MRNIFRKQNRGFFEIIFDCFSLAPLAGQFNIFLRSLFFEENLFLLIFGTKRAKI